MTTTTYTETQTQSEYDPYRCRARWADTIAEVADAALPMFCLNDWRYGDKAGSVPTAERLAETIAYLVDNVERQPNHSGSYARSGRFLVTRQYDGRISIAIEMPEMLD